MSSIGGITDAQLAAMRADVVGLFSESGIRRRFPATTDRYNNETRDLAHPEDVAIPQLMIRQQIGTEVRDGRDTQIWDWFARVPIGTDITGRDQLVVEGKAFEVIGPPEDLGTHLHLKLKFVEG